MCLLTDSGNSMAPSAQLGQLNSSSPRALVLPPMKTPQVGHIHRARPAPSLSSSWSHLSVSAIISFRAPALGWAGVSCLRGDAVQAWHCSSWWMRPTHRAQTHLCPLAAIGDACPGVLGKKMQAWFLRPGLNWVSVAARPPFPPPPAAARRWVRGPGLHPTRCPPTITANWLRPAAPVNPKTSP